MGQDSTAWGSPFNLDSSAQLPGLGETQTTLALSTPLHYHHPPTSQEGMGRGRMQGLPEAPLTSFLPSHPWLTSTFQVLVGPSSVPSPLAPSPRKERRNAWCGLRGPLGVEPASQWSPLTHPKKSCNALFCLGPPRLLFCCSAPLAPNTQQAPGTHPHHPWETRILLTHSPSVLAKTVP